MALCGPCSRMQEQSLAHTARKGGSTWYPLYTHAGLISLQHSVEEGCFFCTQFWCSLSQQHKNILQGPSFAGLIVAVFWDAKELRYTTIHFVVGTEFDACEGAVTDTFELEVYQEGALYCEEGVSCFDELVPRWLQDCNTNHTELCSVTSPASWVPTRLIDVGNEDSEEPPRLILNGDGALLDDVYAAFSYFSEDDDLISLSTSNIDIFQDGLPLMDIPLLFQYAIFATRLLGIRYLWIDALCVLQDSPEDLQKEMTMIGAVYQHCFLNTAAASVDDLRHSLMLHRGKGFTAPCQIMLSDGEAIFPDLVRYTAFPEDIWRSHRQTSLGRHAGFLQNQLLAPRTLYFGRHQVYFECRQLKACETAPCGLPSRMIRDTSNASVADKVLRSITQPTQDTLVAEQESPECQAKNRWCEAWRLVVGELSSRCIPDSRMKLIAISGVAIAFQEVLQDKYLAGMWQNDLLNSLLWYVDGPFQRGIPQAYRPTSYCAPTWSWPSVEGAITHIPSSESSKQWAKVLRAQVFPLEPTIPTGSVTGGFLWLRGWLIEIPAPTVFFVRGSLFAGCFFPDDRSDIVDKHYFCLPLRTQKTTNGTFLCGLVLRQLAKPWALLYQRVGFFRCAKGDSLQILGQKKYGFAAYQFPEDPSEHINGEPFETDIAII